MSSSHGCQCGSAHGACVTEFQYAVKVVCGELKPADDNPVAPGQYWTAINIHNPDKCRSANFRFKVGIAEPAVLDGPVTDYFGPFRLRPDGMVEYDCQNIKKLVSSQFPAPLPFIKGYMVIASDIELDVVAVYSGSSKSCNSFHTERVPARCVPVCEDLVLPLDTGVAEWQTVSPNPTGPVVTLAGYPGTWVGGNFGFTYVSQVAGDASNASQQWREYQLCFDLCDGYARVPQTPIHVLAANKAEVSLNSSAPLGSAGNVGSIPSLGYTAPHLLWIPPNLLKTGRNCLRVDVSNAGGHPPHPTGFALTGILRIGRGKCPCVRLPVMMTQAI